MTFLPRLKNSLLFWPLLSTLLLLWVAFYNGFPVVYSDTSTYLASGFDLETPADRPITYGLFIMLTSLHGISLWIAAAVQSFMLAYILFLVFRHISGIRNYAVPAFISIFILSIFTSLPWISGMLLADVFTPVSIFTLLLLIFAKDLSKREKITLYSFFVLSNAMHLSHVMINVLLLITVLITSKIGYFKESFRFVKIKQLIVLLLISLSGILVMSSAMSKSKHIFYMGRMVENGILKKYLDENCAAHQYKICAYKDSLPPNADRFLWDFQNSPVYKLGGWKACKDEFNEIIGETMKQPEYLKLHALASIRGTTQQLTAFTIGEGNIGFGKETPLYERIQKYTSDGNRYANSKQTGNTLLKHFAFFNTANQIAVYGSLLVLMIILCAKQVRSKFTTTQIVFVIFTLFGIFYNDFICASLSTVANRFACRVIWMVPFLLLLIIANKFQKEKN